MAKKKYTPENVLETLANELEKNTPGTPEYEKIFKQYYDLSQLLETKRTNTQKEKIETRKLDIDQQKANNDLYKINLEHSDREEDRKAQEKLAELNRQAASEQEESRIKAEKLKAKYALWSGIGSAAITAAATITVVGVAKLVGKKTDERRPLL